MTNKEKFYANERREKIFAEAGYECVRCGEPVAQLAHRIAKTKTNIKKYGELVINHNFNLVPVCNNPACNDSFNIGNNPRERDKLVMRITRDIGWWED